MKICMFTNTYLPHVGGVARSVDLFRRDLQDLGHEVMVVAPVYSAADKAGGEEGILRVPALQKFNGSDFSVSLSMPLNISSRINDFRPDIIHSHHPYLLGDAALRTARRLECPLVFTHHTLYEQYTHYVPLDSERLKHFVIHLSTRYANLCDGVIAPSRSIAELIRSRGVSSAIREIPTGVDLEVFRMGSGRELRRACGIDDYLPVIGHVGRLAPEKNLAYLTRAVAACLASMEGVFLVVGRGPSEETMSRIFADAQISPRLVMAGEKTGQELVDAYHAMNVFVFSSKTETQGMVLIEAMAAGKPVVALDASGVREVVVDGKNGRLVDRDSPPEIFASVLADFLRQCPQMRHLNREALATARRLSRKKCASKLSEFYCECLKGCPPQAHDASEMMLSFEKIRAALKAEWTLIGEKAGALADTFAKPPNMTSESDESRLPHGDCGCQNQP